MSFLLFYFVFFVTSRKKLKQSIWYLVKFCGINMGNIKITERTQYLHFVFTVLEIVLELVLLLVAYFLFCTPGWDFHLALPWFIFHVINIFNAGQFCRTEKSSRIIPNSPLCTTLKTFFRNNLIYVFTSESNQIVLSVP